MQKLVWQNANGDSIDLTSGNYGITHWEGFSDTSLNIQSQQVPFQDGAVFLDALLNQRELSVTLKMQDNGNLEERYRMRRELIHILTPKLGEGYLIYTNDFTSKRIKCLPQVPLFPTHNSNDSGTPSASLSWTACEPYWEDLEENVVKLDTTSAVSVSNEGDVPINFVIEIMSGNAKNINLKNLTSHKFINYTDELKNQNLVISTLQGKKTASLLNDRYIIRNIYTNTYGIAYFKNQIVFAGDKCLYTPNLEHYEIIPKIVGGDVQPIACNEELLAITNESEIYYTGDLISWKTVNNNFGHIVGIVYSKKYECFLLINTEREIYKSYDIENWVKIAEGYEEPIFIYNLYVVNEEVFFTTGKRLYKININGTCTQVYYNENEYINGLSYNKNKYYLLCGNKLYYSSDLSEWTEISTDLPQNITYLGILYYPIYDIFIVVTNNGLYKSFELEKWELFFELENFYGRIQNIPEISQLFLCSNNNSFQYSTNLKDWNVYGGEVQYGGSLNYYHGKVIMCCNDFLLNITENDLEEILPENGAVYRKIVPWKNDKVLLFSNKKIYESLDCIHWTLLYTYNGEGNIYSLCANEHAIIFIDSASGFFYISNDNAQSFTNITTDYWNSSEIATNGNYFLFEVAWDGIYKITNDGVISKIYNTSEYTKSLIYNAKENVFVLSTSEGIYVSVEGSNWDKVSLYSPENLKQFNDKVYGFASNGLGISENLSLWAFDPTPFNNADYIVTEEYIYYSSGSNLVAKKYGEEENAITKISKDSDMGLDLKIGDNTMLITCEEGYVLGTLTYRQKYLGV